MCNGVKRHQNMSFTTVVQKVHDIKEQRPFAQGERHKLEIFKGCRTLKIVDKL